VKKSKKNIKESDIRPEEFAGRLAELQRIDAGRLLTKYSEFVSAPCPACDSDNSEYWFTKYGFNFESCNACETIFVNPRPSLSILGDFYRYSPNYEYWNDVIFPQTECSRRESLFRPRVEAIIPFIEKFLPRAEALIEVGAAQGYFLDELQVIRPFERTVAVEATSSLADTLRGKGYEVVEDLVENIGVDFHSKFDVLVSFEVIEHLFSPKDFLEQCSILLRSDGLLFLTCPNGQGFDNLLLGPESATFDHEHLNYFNPNSIKTLVEGAGFDILSIKTPGKLDVDIVRKSVESGKVNLADNRFVKKILSSGKEDTFDQLQTFLAENLLSGHLQVIAQKTSG